MLATRTPTLTVFLVTDGNFSGNFGTAFVVYRDASAAYLLTCAHVVKAVGIDRLQVGGYKPTVVALGEDGKSPDLAVLRVEELKNQPCWSLCEAGKKGKPFATQGFRKDGGNQYLRREMKGKLGERVSIQFQGQSTHFGWDLSIENKGTLQPGNSGSPVWDKKYRALGVVSRRQVAGHEGLAISIDALEEVWKDMPSGLIKKSPIDINPIVVVSGLVGLVASAILLATAIDPPLPTPTPSAKSPCPLVSLEPSSQFQQPDSAFVSDDIKIAGSTSMDNLNQSLKIKFQQKYPASGVSFTSSGSEDGKQKLTEGSVDLAAVSERISDGELQNNSWKTFPISPAPIVVVISPSNPYPKEQGLTSQQVKEIFTGRITQWSQLQQELIDSIRIINRNAESGTRREFQSLALGGLPFGSAPAVEEWPVDETYKVLGELKQNGIYYATCHQAVTQAAPARILSIDGKMPTSDSYPYNRPFLYVYKVDSSGKPSDKVAAFLGFVNSQEGRKIVQEALLGKKP